MLAAGSLDLCPMVARYLTGCDRDAVDALAEVWIFAEDNHRSPRDAWDLLLARMVDFDPEAAYSIAYKIVQVPHVWGIWGPRGRVVTAWAAKDLNGLVAFAEQEPDERLGQVVFREVTKASPALALELLNRYSGHQGTRNEINTPKVVALLVLFFKLS